MENERRILKSSVAQRKKSAQQKKNQDITLVAIVVIIGVILLTFIFLGLKAMVTSMVDGMSSGENTNVENESVLGDYADISNLKFVEEVSRLEVAPYLPTPTPSPVQPNSIEGKTYNNYGNIMTIGTSCFQFYKFNQQKVDNFVKKLNSSISNLNNDVEIFTMIVPSAIDIVLPLSFLEENADSTSDQPKTIDYINSKLKDSINLEISSILKAHCNEKIYFDSHPLWTNLGAYYASQTYKSANGFTNVGLKSYSQKSIAGYNGYLGRYIGGSAASTLESIDYYVSSMDIVMTDPSVNEEENGDDNIVGSPVFKDVSASDSYYKIDVFTGGTEKVKEFTNLDTKNKETLVLVGDDYSNVLVPFLAENYSKTYFVDYREYDGNLSDLVDSVNANDVLYCFNIEATINEDTISKID